MYNLMKFTILILAVITLAACSSSKTRYRTNTVTVTEKTEVPAPDPVIDFNDNFSATVTTPVALAAVTRTARNTNQALTFDPSFTSHPDGTWRRADDYSVTTAGTRNPDALDIRTMAQLYPRDGGNPLLFATTGASTAEFPDRGSVFRTNSFLPSRGLRYPGVTTGRLTIQGTPPPAGTYAWRNWQHPVRASFQFTRSGDNPGMVMKFGGDQNGGAIFSDLESYGGRGCPETNVNCNAPNTHDLTIPFGMPRYNPSGDLAYYWRVLVPNHHLDRNGNVLVPGETVTTLETNPDDRLTCDGNPCIVPQNLGSYTLELSHAATGIDDSADADADHRYLSYAAYGLFNFFDGQLRANPRLGRLQTISYGLDAFADTNGMKTTDLTEANKIEATFKGRTMAYLIHLEGGSGNNRVVQALTRMRGDISLTANIGPANPSDTDRNTITGTISGLEYLTVNDQVWTRDGNFGFGTKPTFSFNYATTFQPDDAVLTLSSGTIAADGSYTGTVTPSTAPATIFRNGQYKGNLYGPLDGLETAGTWWLPAQDAPGGNADISIGGIIGSFGACQDGKGRC